MPITSAPYSGAEADTELLQRNVLHGDDASLTIVPVRASDEDDGDEGDSQVGVATKTRAKPKKPSQYKVLLLNDDYTPMEFVVAVLKRFFNMDMEQATRVMLQVHQQGIGVCGIYTYEIAETKVNQVMDCAKENQHPLQCTLEKA
ncbi:ATP-dependent Clp protease adapter ClpS [Alterisphingorhabdus coralli]|uniref:ATP-dependent Clp protease adapter ClpS n=1 Tax=Alterisphingorhabdus coralli TaxID=3071408 RepID=UPI00387359D5